MQNLLALLLFLIPEADEFKISPQKIAGFEKSSYLCSTSTRQASQRCSNVRVVLFLYMPVSVFKTLATFFSPKNLLYMKNFYCMYLPYTENSQQVADQLEKKDFRIVWLKRARNFCPFRTYSIISTVQVENLQQVAANSGSEMLQ